VREEREGIPPPLPSVEKTPWVLGKSPQIPKKGGLTLSLKKNTKKGKNVPQKISQKRELRNFVPQPKKFWGGPKGKFRGPQKIIKKERFLEKGRRLKRGF